jgi:hypothetical protein
VDGKVVVTRRTMSPTAPPVTLTSPSGKQSQLALDKSQPGIWRGTANAEELGLYRVSDGKLSTVTAAGPLNPKEVADMRATDSVLEPLAKATDGSVRWLSDGMPAIKRVTMGESAQGRGWIGIRRNGAYQVTSLTQQPLLPAWLALLLIVGSLLLAWKIEGR